MLGYMLYILLLFLEATNGAKIQNCTTAIFLIKDRPRLPEEQLPSRTVHFLNCPFYSLFSNYLRSQYLSVVYFVFLPLFWLQNKLTAITENRKQQLEKKRYAKRILWKVFSDNRMGNQGKQLFSD